MSDQEFLHGAIHGSLLAVISKPHRGYWVLLAAAWIWAIWSCAEYWRGNPNYSYGWVVPVLSLTYAARRLALAQSENIARRPTLPVPIWVIFFIGIVAAAIIFGLEFAREQVLHPVIVIWTIAFVPITLTLLAYWLAGGRNLLRAELFPILFFLTAVPWPPRFDQPITAGLMHAVAAATTGLLHWFRIPAQTVGGAITLRTGVVGITEACSGMRSLQAGIMFGLAIGEWFLLRPLRRIALLFVAIALAFATNLIRTLALSLQAEWHGLDAVEKIHDLTGTVAVIVLVIAIWICALALRSPRAKAHFGFENLGARLRAIDVAIPASLQAVALAILIEGIFGIGIAQIVSAKIEAGDQTQMAPFFFVREDPSQTRVRLPRDVWNELHPTSGEYVRVRNPRLGAGEVFHFFWKPSPWNRFVLVHRPDICMPGVGWESVGSPESSTIDFSGHQTQLYLFRFRRGDTEALELWGVWRNGDAVPPEYQPNQVLRGAAAPPALHLEGKRRSATEIVACVIGGNRDHPPDAGRAIAILKSVFQYNPARE